MKVLLVNDYGTLTGGAELVTLALRDRLCALGHDARLFASSARPGGAASQADCQCWGTTSRWRTLLQSANPWAAVQLRRVLAQFRPDVVHVGVFLTQLSPLILPLLRQIPTVLQVHWYRPICPRGTKMLPAGSVCEVPWGAACYRNGCLPLRDWGPLMMQMRLWRRWRGVFRLVLAESQELRRKLEAEGIGPLEVIPHGVPAQPQRPPLAQPPLAAYAGRMVPEKGVDLLLRAFAKVAVELPEARLLLVGDGPERGRLEALIAGLRLADRVTLTGHVTRPQMERLLAAAWVQVVPSRWAEPFGLVAAEGLMRGTAVIAANAGGLAEIVEDGRTGLHVPSGDEAALVQTLLQLLRNRELAEQLGRTGRATALERYSEEAWVERLVRRYQILLQPPEPAPC
jgi:glycosyltransferase involved in cell wall biosynthesis